MRLEVHRYPEEPKPWSDIWISTRPLETVCREILRYILLQCVQYLMSSALTTVAERSTKLDDWVSSHFIPATLKFSRLFTTVRFEVSLSKKASPKLGFKCGIPAFPVASQQAIKHQHFRTTRKSPSDCKKIHWSTGQSLRLAVGGDLSDLSASSAVGFSQQDGQ